MKKTPSILQLSDVIQSINHTSVFLAGNKWVPARSLGFSSFRYRCRAAWLVFTGKADALIWPGDQ